MDFGNFTLDGPTVRIPFNTDYVGDLTTLVGGVVSVMRLGTTTPITAGVSLSVDVASIVGSHEASIVPDSAYFAVGQYKVYLSAGTVAGFDRTGYLIGTFCIGNPTALEDIELLLEYELTDITSVPVGSNLPVFWALKRIRDAYNRIGAPVGADISADVASVKAETATIVSRTDVATSTRLAASAYTTQTGDAYARLGAPAGASVSADIAAVQADTDNIQTRIPAALVSGRMDSSVGAMAAGVVTAAAVATDAIDADAIAADAVTEIQSGLATSAAITALNDFDPTADPVIVGTMQTDVLSASAVSSAAVTKITAGITAPPSAAAIADAVLDEIVSGHSIVGSLGAAITALLSGSSPTAIADAVWTRAGRTLTSLGATLVSFISPVDDIGEVTIWKGATYDSEDGSGHALQWNSTDPVLAIDGVMTVQLYKGGVAVWTDPKVIVPALVSVGTYLISVDLTKDESGALSTGRKKYVLNAIYTTPPTTDEIAAAAPDEAPDHLNPIVVTFVTVKNLKKAA